MQRRKFLAHLAATSGIAFATKPLVALAMEGMNSTHGMEGMAGMHHMGGMDKMGATQQAHSGGSANTQLAPTSALPAGKPFVAPAILANESTAPGHFKAKLVAAPSHATLMPGHTTQVWAYNGQLPGPLIELHAGDKVEITLENRLEQPTTIHWHGLPVPPDQDGNPSAAVAPGKSRVYRFTLPDTVEGLYWYHPHPHGLSAEQVYRGLAGPIMVRPKKDALSPIPERILAVTDLRLAADASIPANTMMDWMNGREGQFALVNGQHRPMLRFATSGQERWRILNATNARYLRLALPGHTFTLLGTDGGRIEVAQTGLKEILLAPAQRVEVLVAATGRSSAALMAMTYDRGKMGSVSATPSLALMNVDFSAAKVGASQQAALPQPLREFAPLPVPVAKKRVVMTESMGMGMGHGDMQKMNATPTTNATPTMDDMPMKMAFLLNGKAFDMKRVDLKSTVGAWEDWEIVNDSDMDHPFHVHGTQFQVLSRQRAGHTENVVLRAWHDTVNLKAQETVRVRIMQTEKGIRMYHCHILEHEDLGMMGRLDVV